ncbi:hypothetical protein KUTeg_010033 [Tegillarca granosa]|uniref:2-methoxy-6-polyprenyl-1,4-benzoquinol methylase, mitochondrial n=1 Tax=Tegillarca granosa TaxID=220873 RepID=A0ABQ9FAL0_TEGGR|nr:hypothetical protein KUTeg_010033 [Tegillarca granosa]
MAASICLRTACRYVRKSSVRSICMSSQKLNKAESDSDTRQTHFGFEYIPEEEKESRVYEVFKNVATKYDLMNDAMSVGIHRLWKDHFIQRLAPTHGTQLLDVAGDIALRYLQFLELDKRTSNDNAVDDFKVPNEIQAGSYGIPPQYHSDDSTSDTSSSDSSEDEDTGNKFSKNKPLSHVTVCDINQEMLDVGKEKALNLGYLKDNISWVKGNAESLPFDDNKFDAYTIAFGIRNCTHVIEESYRVLKPGGRFMCLEFSQVLARDWKSYQYLVESIRQFPDQEEFAAMIQQAGFSFVTYENLTFGVAAIHSGFKL